METCELCQSPAKLYCESDEANLCWDCDAKVHGANFLVARHVRSLLCNACYSLTPWNASGSKLGHTVSVCERCVGGGEEEESEAEEDDEEIDSDDEILISDDNEEDNVEEEEISVDDDKEDDYQIVPSSLTPPPPATSSSCSDVDGYVSDMDAVCSLKRKREIVSDRPIFSSGSAATNTTREDGGSSSAESLKRRKPAVIRSFRHEVNSGNTASDSSKEAR